MTNPTLHEPLFAAASKRKRTQEAQDMPLTKAVKLALLQTTMSQLDLPIEVLHLENRMLLPDELNEFIPAGLHRINCDSRASARACCAFDDELRAAIIEMQTMGRISDSAATDRPASKLDFALIAPFAEDFLTNVKALCETVPGAEAFQQFKPKSLIEPDIRSESVFIEPSYSGICLEVKLGETSRRGRVSLVTPKTFRETSLPTAPNSKLKELAMDIAMPVKFEIASIEIALSDLHALQKLGVIELPFSALDKVKLTTMDGTVLHQVALGKRDGHYAVRVGERKRFRVPASAAPSGSTKVDKKNQVSETSTPASEPPEPPINDLEVFGNLGPDGLEKLRA